MIKFLITFGIIVAMNANVERLRAQTFENGIHGQNDVFIKLKMFQYACYTHTTQLTTNTPSRHFRWAFLAYLIIPIILLFVNFAVLSWQQAWIPVRRFTLTTCD